MDCPNFAVLQFDPSGHHAVLFGRAMVVQFVFSIEVFGKDFGMEAIILIDPGSKLLGCPNDLFVYCENKYEE
jgi:hypothetical protein